MTSSLCLRVFGDYACFTRPEMKVERVSYDVITPSAGRAIFEAILWKPAIRWHITRVDILRAIRWISVRRNEVGCVASISNAQRAMNAGSGNLGIYVEDERQQRAGLFLRDVAYRLHARLELTEKAGSGEVHDKFRDMFRRRARNGQCFTQPYLGCREFACYFDLVEDPVRAAELEPPVMEDHDLGWMLHDIEHSNNRMPRFFRAQMRGGIVEVPDWESEEVRR
jgi:CRISPR-associated protein Cas5d